MDPALLDAIPRTCGGPALLDAIARLGGDTCSTIRDRSEMLTPKLDADPAV